MPNSAGARTVCLRANPLHVRGFDLQLSMRIGAMTCGPVIWEGREVEWECADSAVRAPALGQPALGCATFLTDQADANDRGSNSLSKNAGNYKRLEASFAA